MEFRKSRNEIGLPYPVIVAASNGEVQAMKQVLNYYDGYIISLSKRTLYDEYGNSYICVDESIRQRLQSKLIVAVLKFKIA